MTDDVTLSPTEAMDLARTALMRVGMAEAAAAALARATLDAEMAGKRTVGFTATGTLKRSDYGVTAVIPLTSDEVKIDIAAAFEKAE